MEAGADVVTLGNHAFDQKEALVFIERQPAAAAAHQLSAGHARPGRRPLQDRQRCRRAGHQRHGPDLHARARRSVPRGRRGARRLRAQAGRRRHPRSTSTPRRPARSRRSAISSTGARLRRRHPHACANGRPARAAERHGLHFRHRHVRGLQLGARHGRRGADQPLPDQDPARALRAGERSGTLSGLAVEIDDETGLARACSAFRLGPNLEPAEPAFWAS